MNKPLVPGRISALLAGVSPVPLDLRFSIGLHLVNVLPHCQCETLRQVSPNVTGMAEGT
jgi:hypothetical protein